MILSLITPPAELPIDADHLKDDWLKVSEDSEEVLIAGLHSGCTELVEKITNRKLVEQTWEFKFRAQSSNKIELPFPPLKSVNSVKYYDSSNVLQTVSPSNYLMHKDSLKGYIELLNGYTIPATYPRDDAIIVNFTAGYGDADAVPDMLKTAIKMLIAHYYENRQPLASSEKEIPMSIGFIISPFKVRSV